MTISDYDYVFPESFQESSSNKLETLDTPLRGYSDFFNSLRYFDSKSIKGGEVNTPYNDYVLNKTREFRRRIGFNSFLINLGINTKRRSLESISKIFNEMGVLDSPDITETEKIIKGFCGQQLYYGNGTLGFEIYTNKKGKKIIKITNPAYSKINIFKEALTPLSFKGRYSFNSEPCLF